MTQGSITPLFAQELQPQQMVETPDNLVSITKARTQLAHPSRFETVAQLRKSFLQLTPQHQWETATDAQRGTANKRRILLRLVLAQIEEGANKGPAIRNVIAHCKAQRLPTEALRLATLLANKGQCCPSRSTFYDWLTDYEKTGLPGLLPKHTGRVRPHEPWHIPALTLYHIPSKPGFSEVAIHLRPQGFDVHHSSVNRLIKSLPAQYGPLSPWRVGRKFYTQNIGPHKTTDKEVYAVGQRYEGDGHRVDVWIANPSSGTIFRPELTVWIDVRSNYVVGWHLSKDESAESTIYSMSSALVSQDHVPNEVHVDNGSGFVSKIMLDYFDRFDIQVHRAIPGNSKGKGLIEGWFKKIRNRHDKFFMGGGVYCGDDMAPEALQELHRKLRKGEVKLPSYEQLRDSLAAYIEFDRSEPQRGLGKKSPASLWASLKREPIELMAEATIRPQEERTVRRCRISFYNRIYTHPLLQSFHQRKIRVEYDFNDDSRIWVFDSKKRLICVAHLLTKTVDAGASVSEDRQKQRTKGRKARAQKHVDIIDAEEASVITHDQQLSELVEWTGDTLLEDQTTPSDFHDLDIDIYEDHEE